MTLTRRDIAISDLLPCPLNRDIDPEKVHAIKDAITSTGEIKPLSVTEIDTNSGKRMMVSDGHHRLIALKSLQSEGKLRSDVGKAPFRKNFKEIT